MNPGLFTIGLMLLIGGFFVVIYVSRDTERWMCAVSYILGILATALIMASVQG